MKTAVLDVGGTSIKSGIWEKNKLWEVKEFPTDAKKGGQAVMEKVIGILHKYGQFDQIGISTAGQVDSERGLIRHANANIPEYTGMKIRDILKEEFHVPIAVENDVNAAAIGEAVYGAGCEEKSFLCLTYGTGVGGAIVMDRKVFKGVAFSAGEFGSMITHADSFGRPDIFGGSYERFASTSALIQKMKEYHAGIENGRKVFEQIGDPQVKEILDLWIHEIMYGLITLIYIFNPSCIVMGGGILEQNYILDKLNHILYKNMMPSFHHVKLRKAKLGNRAGLIGVAYLADTINSEQKYL